MTTLTPERASELTMDLLAEVAREDGGDGTRIIAILDEVAANPRDAVTLCHAIVAGTALILREKWKKAGVIADGDLVGLMRTPGARPDPEGWRAAQMLTATFNGDANDSIDHAIVAANDGRMEQLMAALLLQWHRIIRLEVAP